MIAIVDYGMGNLRSVHKAFQKIGYDAVITDNRNLIADADKVVLPGVGAFCDCMRNLESADLIDIVLKSIQSGKPFLGICLGLQLLFTESEEFGLHKGLDAIKGKVVRFPPDMAGPMTSLPSGLSINPVRLKVPHMGWNRIEKVKDVPILTDVPDGSYVYFVHSYYVIPNERDLIATTTDYGIRFTSMIWKDNIYATQFHPEKSQEVGLKILKRFGEIK